MKPFVAAAAFAAVLLVPSIPAYADYGGPGTFDRLLDQQAPECVPVSAIKSVSTVTDLTSEQFQFVRALYVALPPGFTDPSSGRPCNHGDFRRLCDACACLRHSSLRAISRP